MKISNALSNVLAWAIGIVLCGVFLALIWVLPSAIEASAYNRVTGSNVTTWEAMFLNLRVQDAPKESGE